MGKIKNWRKMKSVRTSKGILITEWWTNPYAPKRESEIFINNNGFKTWGVVCTPLGRDTLILGTDLSYYEAKKMAIKWMRDHPYDRK